MKIEDVAQLCGLTAAQIRNWETRYGFPKPERDAHGRRTYSITDVEFLKRSAAWLRIGVRPVEIAALYRKGAQVTPTPVFPKAPPAPGLAVHVNEIYTGLVNGDLPKVEERLSFLWPMLGTRQILETVFMPLMGRLGSDWVRGDIGIWQEHVASQFLRTQLFGLLMQWPAPTIDGRILLCTVHGEQHTGGVLLIANRLRMTGHRAEFIGDGYSIKDLHQACETIKPRVVCLSFLMDEPFEDHLSDLSDLTWNCQVLLGGPAVGRWLKQHDIANLHCLDRNPKIVLSPATSLEEVGQVIELLHARESSSSVLTNESVP